MMKLFFVAMLHVAGCASSRTNGCTGDSREEGGNSFCAAVGHIVYSGIRGQGSYTAVTEMTKAGKCSYRTEFYSGPLAPLDRDLSLHFRGPLELAEVAVYNPKASEDRRRADVVATIDGKVVSWVNNWFGNGASPTAAASVRPAPAGTDSPPEPKPATLPSENGRDWSRIAYYNAKDGVADNLVFLGNYGGQGSGRFDSAWGNSLSFLNSSGDGGSSTSEVLSPGRLRSNKEFSIWSNEPCGAGCGYARAEDVAFKGFPGANKIFLFNFKMPLDGDRGYNGDMPAIWALNGCGEADFIEVLASGDLKCKSTLHLTTGGGASDYFKRPTDHFVRYAVVFQGETASMTIRQLPGDVEFVPNLESDLVKSWVARDEGVSIFNIG